LVYTYVALCGGAEFVALPGLNQVMIGGLVAKMIQEISALYRVSLTRHKAKLILLAVLGGAHAE